MFGPCAYADRSTTENGGVKLHGISEGKSSLMIFEQWGNARYQYRNLEFWCRGYYVDTVGKNTKAIKEYIRNQLREDAAADQLTMEEVDPFTGSK